MYHSKNLVNIKIFLLTLNSLCCYYCSKSHLTKKKPYFSFLHLGLCKRPSFSLLLLSAPFYPHPVQIVELDQERDEENLSTHPPIELNIKRTQKFCELQENKNIKLQFP